MINLSTSDYYIRPCTSTSCRWYRCRKRGLTLTHDWSPSSLWDANYFKDIVGHIIINTAGYMEIYLLNEQQLNGVTDDDPEREKKWRNSLLLLIKTVNRHVMPLQFIILESKYL